MIVRDILPETPLREIEVRTNWPEDCYDGKTLTQHEEEWGTLFGFCAWDGYQLIPLDGDFYSLNEEVTKYLWEDGKLIYWIHSDYTSHSQKE